MKKILYTAYQTDEKRKKKKIKYSLSVKFERKRLIFLENICSY